MSPILDLQRRLVEVGRLRLGEKRVKETNGRKVTYPAKLAKWRLTSKDRQRLEAVAHLYGGTVREWEDQWELYTDTDVLDVAVVPGQAINQHYEAWGQEHPKSHKGPNPVICLRRCDGQTCMVPNPRGKGWVEQACLCADEEEPACKPTTRLSVVLTRVPGLGVWRCDSKGWNAATELAGGVQLLEALVASGRPVRARLRVEVAKEVKRAGTFQYVKPVLDIDHTLDEVLAITQGGGGAPAALAAPAVRAIEAPAFTPVPDQGPPPDADRSVADQLRAPVETGARGPHVPIKGTGRSPRKESGAGEASTGDAKGSVGPSSAPAPRNGGPAASPAPDEPPSDEPPADDEGRGAMPLPQSVAMWCKDAGIDTDDDRHRFLIAFSRVVGDGEYSSAKDVPREHVSALRAALVRVKRGELRLDPTEPVLYGDEDMPIAPGNTGMPVTPAGATDGAWDAARWRGVLKDVPGIGEAKLLRQARTIAADLKIDPPKSLDEVTDDHLVIQCLQWLKEQQT